MTYLYCKKVDDKHFDLRYRPLDLLKAEHNLADLTDEQAIAELVNNLGYYQIKVPAQPEDGYKYAMTVPELVEGVLQVTWVRVDEAATSERLNMLARLVKSQRAELLAQSDWTQLADVPLSAEKKQQWETYRQALRDISSQAKFPWRIDWPVAP